MRDREGDVQLLATHFLRAFARENDREGMRFSPEAMAALVKARWVGNVRELRNLAESLVVLVPGDVIGLGDLPPEYASSSAGAASAAEAAVATPEAASGGVTMEEIEHRAILNALEKTGGNRTQAAEMLGIGLRTLQRKIKEYRMAGTAEGY